MAYIALKRMTVEGREVVPGDPVPEAASWPNVRAYLNVGHIKEVFPCSQCGHVEGMAEAAPGDPSSPTAPPSPVVPTFDPTVAPKRSYSRHK